MRRLTQERRVLALSLLVVLLASCGGTITFGRSLPTAQVASQARNGQPPNQTIPSPAPGTTSGTLLALDAGTGSTLWQARVPMAAMSQPVVSGGLVFVQGGFDCRSTASVVAAFDAKTGSSMWVAPTTANRYGFSLCGSEFAPTVGSGIVLTNEVAQSAGPSFSATSFVLGLDPRTGRRLWTVQGEEPAAGAGLALVLVQAPGGGFNVRALDPITGQERWEAPVSTVNLAPSVNGRTILVPRYGCQASSSSLDISPSHCSGPGQGGSFVSSLDPAAGRLSWQVGFGQGSQINRRLLLGDVVVFTYYVETPPSAGQPPSSAPPTVAIGALDPANGAELWRQTVVGDASVPTLAVPGTVFLMDRTASSGQACTNRLDALDSKSGRLRWRTDSLQVCQLDLASERATTALVLTTAPEAKIVVVNTATGAELWEAPIATTGPYRLAHATISEGVIYVAESGQFILPPPSD